MKKVEGVAIGTVTAIDAGLGRVKVSFPWFSPAQESNWAPIASLMSGNKRGARFMPEKDDEVLVAFDHGDYEHPYVVGFLWNGADKAPDDKRENRVIVTPGGHELRFEDKDGDKRVVLKTKDGHQLSLDDKDAKVTLTTKSGGKVTLDNAPGVATVEASGNRIVISPAGVTIMVTTGALSVTSSAVTTVQSTGVMSIAAPVVNVAASGVLNVTAPLASFSGVLRAQAVQADLISGATYTPGIGNLI